MSHAIVECVNYLHDAVDWYAGCCTVQNLAAVPTPACLEFESLAQQLCRERVQEQFVVSKNNSAKEAVRELLRGRSDAYSDASDHTDV